MHCSLTWIGRIWDINKLPKNNWNTNTGTQEITKTKDVSWIYRGKKKKKPNNRQIKMSQSRIAHFKKYLYICNWPQWQTHCQSLRQNIDCVCKILRKISFCGGKIHNDSGQLSSRELKPYFKTNYLSLNGAHLCSKCHCGNIVTFTIVK